MPAEPPDLLVRLAEISRLGDLNDVEAVSKALDASFETKPFGPFTNRHVPSTTGSRPWRVTWYVTTKPDSLAKNKGRAVMQIQLEPQAYCVRVEDMERTFGANHREGYVVRDFISPEARDKWAKEAVHEVDLAEYSLPGTKGLGISFSFGRGECLSHVVIGQESP